MKFTKFSEMSRTENLAISHYNLKLKLPMLYNLGFVCISLQKKETVVGFIYRSKKYFSIYEIYFIYENSRYRIENSNKQ